MSFNFHEGQKNRTKWKPSHMINIQSFECRSIKSPKVSILMFHYENYTMFNFKFKNNRFTTTALHISSKSLLNVLTEQYRSILSWGVYEKCNRLYRTPVTVMVHSRWCAFSPGSLTKKMGRTHHKLQNGLIWKVILSSLTHSKSSKIWLVEYILIFQYL